MKSYPHPFDKSYPFNSELTQHDASMLRAMKYTGLLAPMEAPTDTRTNLRRWELRIILEDMVYEFAEARKNPTKMLGKLLKRKGIREEMAWELCKERWLRHYGYTTIR